MAPAGWTFKPQKMNPDLTYLLCRTPDSTNWPAAQIGECESMPQCQAVVYALNSDKRMSFCYQNGYSNRTELNDLMWENLEGMPLACMGTMVQDCEWVGVCFGLVICGGQGV